MSISGKGSAAHCPGSMLFTGLFLLEDYSIRLFSFVSDIIGISCKSSEIARCTSHLVKIIGKYSGICFQKIWKCIVYIFVKNDEKLSGLFKNIFFILLALFVREN